MRVAHASGNGQTQTKIDTCFFMSLRPQTARCHLQLPSEASQTHSGAPSCRSVPPNLPIRPQQPLALAHIGHCNTHRAV